MKNPMRTLTLILALVLVACGASPEPSDQSNSTTSPVGSTTSVPAGTTSTEGATATMPVDPDLPAIAPAREDLARRLDVDPDEIEILVADEVTWPDGSLGCPEPGMSYTQALVDGSQVVLRHGDRVYDYHAGADDIPFLCPSQERDSGYPFGPVEDKDGGWEFVPPPGFHE